MRGAAPKAVQELVGHSTLTMTLRYMHLAPSALREAVALLDFEHSMGIAEEASAQVCPTRRDSTASASIKDASKRPTSLPRRDAPPKAELAEREGFEPSVPSRVHMISNHAPSAARSPLLQFLLLISSWRDS